MNGRRPTIASRRGVVAAAHPLAAAAGAHILAAGGNAFDAAVATAATLNVAEPYMSGIGGMGLAIAYVATEKRVKALDYINPVPSRFPAGRFTSRDELRSGAMSVATPGNFAGWCALHAAHGSRPLPELLAPAIAAAEEGVALLEFNATMVALGATTYANAPYYRDWLAAYGNEGLHRTGDVLRQPDLAATLRTLAAEGPGYLHGGPLGQKIAAHIAALGGCVTDADIAAVSPRWVDPLAASFRGRMVHTVPPPCEGFQMLLTLRILDGYAPAAGGLDGAAGLDRMWRAIRLAAGARIRDNNPTADALGQMFSDERVAALRVRLDDAAPVVGLTEQFFAPAEAEEVAGYTTSFSIGDSHGNMVCVTQSLGAVFGSGIVVPGTGIALNNFLYWGEVDPRGANALRPGGAFAQPMSPTISTRDGAAVLALGTPGSYGICQTQAQALVRLFEEGMAPQDAIEAPRARLWDGARVDAEDRIAPEAMAALRARGHAVEPVSAFHHSCGGMQAVARDPATGVLTGAADPRRDGYVVPV